MVFSRYTLYIAIRLLLLAGTMFLLMLAFLKAPGPFTLLLLLFLLAAQFWYLLRFLNRTNDELASFFLGFQKQDATRSFRTENLAKNFPSLHDSFNKLTGMLQQARQQREQQQWLYQAVVDQVAAGMLVFDKQGKIIFHNQTAVALLGVESLGHLDHLRFVCPELPAFIRELLPGKPRVYSLPLAAGRKNPVSFSSKEMRLGNQQLVLLALQPIGSQLEQKEVESWEKLIRVLTHEIMNTLTPVITLSENIQRCLTPLVQSHGLPPEMQAPVHDASYSASLIASRGASMMEFVENYRSLSLPPKPRLQRVILEDFLKKQLDLFTIILEEKNIRLTFHPLTPGLECYMDPQLISQAIINLIKNAIQAVENKREPAIEVAAGSLSGQLFIMIGDNGCGIAAEHLDSVFVPFFTTRAGGSGVGLSLCRQIMSLHQGSILLESEPDKGCRVKLLF